MAAFRKQVLEPDAALASAAGRADAVRGPIAFAALKVAEAVTRLTGARLRAGLERS